MKRFAPGHELPMRRAVVPALLVVTLLGWWGAAAAQPRTFNVNYTSRATFKTEAPLETVIGTTAGAEAITGQVIVDPGRPQDVKGTIRVDLNALKTGIDRRDAAMRSKNFLDSEDNEANRYAVFEARGAEVAGPLEPGKSTPAKVRGTLTVRGKPIETVAECTINYVRLSPEQVETQKRYGFTAENLRVTARFNTSFTNHGMQIPQLLVLKVSNDIQLEVDLVLVLAQ
jgi:polyisoprenoid-binding protein YceI